MSIWKRIAGAVGSLLLAAPYLAWLFRNAKRLLDYGGYLDFLTSHAGKGDKSWVASMLNFLVTPPPFYVSFLLTVAGTAFLFASAKMKAAHVDKIRTLFGKNVPDAPTLIAASPAKHVVPAMPASIYQPNPEPPKVITDLTPKTNSTDTYKEEYQEFWEDKQNYEVLFLVDRPLKRVSLKFLPDSNKKGEDGLLITLFAYRKFFGLTRVSLTRMDQALCEIMLFGTTGNARLLMTVMTVNAPKSIDVAKDKLHNYVEVVGLAKGGFLEINDFGYKEAYNISVDLIRRA